MADDAEEEGGGGGERWTCEACGCNTNAAAARTCGICGTSNSGPIGRRGGGAAAFAARAGWFSRGLSGSAARRAAAVAGIMGDELSSMEDDDLWESVVQGVAASGGDAAVAAGEDRTRLVESSRQRFLEAARAFSQAASHRESSSSSSSSSHTNVDPAELLQSATANAASYQPHWANPTQLAPRGGGGGGIEVGEGVERQNLAHVPGHAGEGRAIRTAEPLPRSTSGGSFRNIVSAGGATNNPVVVEGGGAVTKPPRRAFGFRVAFDHPASGDVTGADMGGCYLVGVTSSSFSAYNEQNGLQQSPFFWGIEDGGQKYEGSRHASGGGSSRVSSRGGGGSHRGGAYAVDITDAPLNEHSVLFGAREVVTCVCDMDSRTLTFWRDETLLGTLVTNVPRSGNLYPVAVPFNCGVTVAITGLDNCPLPLLRTFATDWRKIQQEKDDIIRSKLAAERAVLIDKKSPSEKLQSVLREIFAMYCSESDKDRMDDDSGNDLHLTRTMASRLWYRCGMKLSSLEEILAKTEKETVCFKDFLEVIENVIADDEATIGNRPSGTAVSVATFEVGDKVELKDGYEKFGDASGGPLHPGDRGTVVELQRGPNGEKRSVRVLHNSRRWWYQPQAIISERSGLTETPGAWFLHGLLRSHGYEHTTLEPMAGKPVTPSSWQVGDFVVPKKSASPNVDSEGTGTSPLIGLIVADTPGTSASSSSTSPGRDSGTVTVEYTSKAFADSVGVRSTGISAGSPSVEIRRVRTSKLVHSSGVHSENAKRVSAATTAGIDDDDDEKMEDSNSIADFSGTTMEMLSASVSEKIQSEIDALARLDRSAIDAVTKECRKSPEALASLFAAGLPDAVLSAMNVAERQMNSLEPREDLPETLAAVGELANAMAQQLYSKTGATPKIEDSSVEASTSERQPAQNRPRQLRNQQPQNYRRLRSGRREARSEEDRAAELSSLQQRRNMLLSLMSRASRRGNASAFLNDMAEMGGGGDPLARELALGQLPPPLAPMRGMPPFVFGAPNDIMDGNWDEAAQAVFGDDSSGQELAPMEVDESTSQSNEPTVSDSDSSYLDSILRCRGDVTSASLSSGLKQGGAAFSVFVRQLIKCGILIDNVEWAQALVDAHCQKIQLSSLPMQRSSSILRNVADEEGTPLLLLAVSLGCSAEVVSKLICWGAPVGKEEIKKAALTDQPEALAALLLHASYKEGVVDVDLCSPEVKRVIDHTKSRQNDLDKKMRDAAGNFMSELLRKLFKLSLSCRRSQTALVDMCSKVICEMLVGNVLLRALQQAQKSSPSGLPMAASLQDTDRATSDSSTRSHMGDRVVSAMSAPKGLLGSLPRSLLGDCLFSEKGHITAYLLVVEDYLCSKELADTAAGLTFLSILLTNFPRLSSCHEMDRFGMKELVSHHSALASSRIADILSKQLSVGLDVSSTQGGPRDESSPHASLKNCEGGTILCPKNHTAVLHITRHSSFRCDLCGKGVDRGRPMHGCRECDWDACEECTDKSESGLVKCTALRELATECDRLLSDEESLGAEDNPDYGDLFEALSENDSSTELNKLSVRLLNRDVTAAKDLGDLLNEPSRVTVHQFLTVILPALHDSLVGRSKGNDGAHRKKKARVVETPDAVTSDSPDLRLEYCREALRHMVMEEESGGLSDPLGSSPVAGVALGETAASAESEEKAEAPFYDKKENPGIIDISYSAGASEILRRLHQILSLYESVKVLSTSSEKASRPCSDVKPGDIQALKKPIELRLSPSAFSDVESVFPNIRSVVHAEPLVPFMDLQQHVLRTYKLNDPLYLAYCRSLVADNAIIVERPMNEPSSPWRIARIAGFDEKTGVHRLRYASGWKRGQERPYLRIEGMNAIDFSQFRFFGIETTLVLTARQYYVVFRASKPGSLESSTITTKSHQSIEEKSDSQQNASATGLVQAIGTRVESNCGLDGSWNVFTLIGRDENFASDQAEDTRYLLVSDQGELFSGVSPDQIRAQDGLSHGDSSRSRRPTSRSSREDGSGLFPFFAARQRSDSARESESFGSKKTALQRTWSALSLVDSMRPIDLNVTENSKECSEAALPADLNLTCKLDDSEFQLFFDIVGVVEVPPLLCIRFSTNEKLPGVEIPMHPGKTIVCALKELHETQETWSDWPPTPVCNLFFSVKTKSSDQNTSVSRAAKNSSSTAEPIDFVAKPASDFQALESWPPARVESRARKLSSRSLTNDDNDDDNIDALCDGVDTICVQCMEVIGQLSECAEDRGAAKDNDVVNLPVFANASLSKKLTEQLDDPVCVVGGALPEWCTVAPSFAPRVFSYDSRRMLLERSAFGVSRSTLKQQEAKVNVGRLRQRMASLRARAVELVGEAFSGGAEDPTALQLQADELYGLEEALATRVRASFRAVKWQEHALQVAKAAVRRDNLLCDAAAVMHRYATDSSVCRRRLEVRFEGESGFDAASGDEAGVTRGFYADVAEKLLSSETVAGVYCSSSCAAVAPAAASLKEAQPMDVDELEKEAAKLPLWIPDMDSSAQVIIPTPRANPQSGLGVFPRAIPTYHPQFADVLEQFRLIGRLFAAAMRDGFMFPLPLSSAFLKLVQHGTEPATKKAGSRSTSPAPSSAELVLASADLPRPGFLGGEVYAAEVFICRALDRLDSADPPLLRSELKRRYDELAMDKQFARVAFGKSYNCSFEEYFQDRTFVDPLDPTQGEDAVPLCPRGHSKPVTIYNIRDWVALAKSFMLHDGVIAQALAFRQGVQDFFSADFLKLFTAEELQRDVCGIGDHVDNWSESDVRKLFKLDGGKGASEALVAVAAIGGEGGAALSRRFGPSSPTIAYLVKALLEGSPKQRRQFLNFVTSVPIVTPGKIEVVPMVSPSGEFLAMNDPCCLPRANTCARRLYLPKFETFESFSEVLWAVVREESRFKGFYEWRGS